MVALQKVKLHDSTNRTNFDEILDGLRQDPGYVDVGATACFTGIVRGFARDGSKLKAIIIKDNVDTIQALEKISAETEERYDIVQQCAIHMNIGEILINEPLMFVMIAGTQGPERVPELFDIIVKTLDRVKREANLQLLEIPKDGGVYVTEPEDSTKTFD